MEKARELKTKTKTKTSISASLTMLKSLTVCTITNCGKVLKRWEYQTILPVSLETCRQVKKQQLEMDIEQLTCFKLEKKYEKAVYYHPTYLYAVSSVHLLSCVQLFVTPWTAARWPYLSNTCYWSLLKLMSIESVMPSNHLILCRALLLLPSMFPSNRVFSNESDICIRWKKYWSFSFSISPFNEYSGLISFRIDIPRDSKESSPTPQFKSINS